MPIHDKNDLKNNIQEYLNLKKIENEYKQEISKLKQSYDVIENNIVSYMNNNDYLDKEIIFEKNKLKCSNTKTSETIRDVVFIFNPNFCLKRLIYLVDNCALYPFFIILCNSEIHILF